MKKTSLIVGLAIVLCSGRPAESQVKGSGTQSYVPLWKNSTTLENSKIYQTGGNVGIDTTSPNWPLDVKGKINASDGYYLGGGSILATPGGSAAQNIAVGSGALSLNPTGDVNTATGVFAMAQDQTGSYNTAMGFNVMSSNTSGNFNSAFGEAALLSNTTGSNNIAIGYVAGLAVNGGSNNIEIGNQGSATDGGTIRIGTSGTQTAFFVAGVRGITTGNNNAIPVMIDSNGQLGTVSSSRRFKEDIQDMGDASLGLMRLRPVTFRYQAPFADGSKPIQYGLVAEEVADVYPELVAHSADGQVEAVKYQVLDSMLLNEVQRQRTEIQELRDRLTKMEAAFAALPRNPQNGTGAISRK